MNADSPAGMMMKFASETTKPFVDDYLLSPETADAVKGNYLHIHDKDYYPTKSLTCVQHPLDKVLKYGFSAGHGESRPAKRIETASIIGCISLETAQNEMHGGQAIPAFDFYLAPYVRSSFVEEVKNTEAIFGQDFSDLYDIKLDDFIKKPLDEPYYRDIAIATSAAAQPSTITRMFCEHALEWARDTSSVIAPATAEAPEYAELAK